MDINDVLTLARAGFSREEIAAIVGGATSAPAPAPAPAPVQEVEKPVETVEKPAEDPAQGASAEQMLAEILGLKQLIQTSNINNSQQPATMTTAQAADAALAAIINPHKQEG